MTPATLTALSSELLEIAREHEITGHSGEVMQKAAAILEQVAGADAGCPVVGIVGTQLGYHATLAHEVQSGAFETRTEVKRGFVPDHKAIFMVGDVELGAALIRQTDHLAVLTAQSGEGVALYEALKEIAGDYADRFDLDSPSTNPGIKSSIKQARAAIAAYEAKRGGVR